MKQLLSAYQKSALDAKVMGASPHGLIFLLLEKLCDQLCVATGALTSLQLGETNITELTQQAATALDHALKISQGLEESLSEEHDKELAQQLAGLYQHIQYQIIAAVQHQDPGYSKQAVKVATDILTIWQSIPDEFHYSAQ